MEGTTENHSLLELTGRECKRNKDKEKRKKRWIMTLHEEKQEEEGKRENNKRERKEGRERM